MTVRIVDKFIMLAFDRSFLFPLRLYLCAREHTLSFVHPCFILIKQSATDSELANDMKHYSIFCTKLYNYVESTQNKRVYNYYS